ncbi:hypothetical protein [Larkinella sp. C7]|uniref:hypothetical protein n=1 Tax=Larkinella sp. C7 TaxID=2576607 RepID=UPI0011110FCF|nr:hypothetical protein [Larkinella sp. C7]
MEKPLYQLPNRRFPYAVGIDPDLKASGVGMWSRKDRKVLVAQVMPFVDLQAWLLDLGKDHVFVHLEAGYLNPKANYHTVKLPKGVEPGSIRAKDYEKRVREEMARRVGQNEGVGLTIKAFLEHHGFGFVEEMPRKEKWTRLEFTRFTGLKTNNQEIIDACSYVVGL